VPRRTRTRRRATRADTTAGSRPAGARARRGPLRVTRPDGRPRERRPVTVAATVLRCPRCRMAVATWATTCPGCGGPIRTAARPPAARPPAARPQAPKPQAPRPAASPARRSSRPYVAAAIVVVVALAAGGFFVRTVGDAFRDASSRAAAPERPHPAARGSHVEPIPDPAGRVDLVRHLVRPGDFRSPGPRAVDLSQPDDGLGRPPDRDHPGRSVRQPGDRRRGTRAQRRQPVAVLRLRADDPPAWVGPGQHTFKISTMDGAELASGTVTVTP
jgi:hypothetical protein